jgi:hypothetical protein
MQSLTYILGPTRWIMDECLNTFILFMDEKLKMHYTSYQYLWAMHMNYKWTKAHDVMVFENYNLKSYIVMNGYHVHDKSHILEKQVKLCRINNNQLIQYKIILNT